MMQEDRVQGGKHQDASLTENIYQTLQLSNPQEISRGRASRTSSRLQLLLLSLIVLLLLTILLIVAVHYAHFVRPSDPCKACLSRERLSSMSGQQHTSKPTVKQNRALWRLHGDSFYLFWIEDGTCLEAKRFCRARDAKLAEIRSENTDWIINQTFENLYWMADGLDRCVPPIGPTSSPYLRPLHIVGWICEKRVLSYPVL